MWSSMVATMRMACCDTSVKRTPLERREARTHSRNEDLVQSLRSLLSALPCVVSSPIEQDDAQLVKANQHGDQIAFALLIQRHQRRVFNLALGMLQDYDDASESTQEAFLAAWQGLPGFRGEARFPTWLSRITYHCCLRQLLQRWLRMHEQAGVRKESLEHCS